MTGPRVDVPPLGKVLSGDEWEASQYAKPGADPTKQSGPSRILTGDEWEHAQTLSAPAIKTWKIPAVPKLTNDFGDRMNMAGRDASATGRDNRTKGKNLAPFDIADPTTYANPILRQIVHPAMDNPLTTIGMAAAPMAVPASAGIAVGLAMAGSMVHTIASYGWQKAAELQLSPEDRARAEADPERISGESAAVQAAMLGLAPLIHVGVKGYRSVAADRPLAIRGVKPAPVSPDAPLPSVAHGDVTDMTLPLGTNRFASDLEAAAAMTRIPQGTPKPEGFASNAVDMKGGKASGKTPEGLIAPESVKPGKVTPIATEDAIAAARSADAERVLRRQATGIRRRVAGEKQPFFETEQGAQTLGAAAARHGLPEDANPYHPDQPQAAAWTDGHASATETVPIYPEGFSMGGALTDNRIPGAGEVPPVARGVDGLQQNLPEGVTPENVALANALKPSRFRGHSTEELAGAALDAQKAIQDAQAAQVAARQRGLVGEAAQADLENRGVSYSDSAEAPSKTADKQLAAAQSRLAQIEREFAMRGVTGDQIAEHVQAAQELRAEREGMAQDEHLAGVAGDDPFATPAPASEPVAAGTAPAQGLASVQGTGETRTRGLSAGVERKALANKITETVGALPEYQAVSMADQAARAADLLSTDPALARRIALGEVAAPHDLLPESVFVAVENQAIKNGDVGTIRELATGKLTGDATTMGQRIRALGERDPESPVAAIKKVIDVRMGGAKGVPRATEETIANIRKQLNALEVKPEAWAKFIDSLRC